MRKVQLTIKQEEVAPATTSDLVVMNNGKTLKEELSTNVLDKFSREVTVNNSMNKIIDGALDGVYESGVMYGRSLVNNNNNKFKEIAFNATNTTQATNYALLLDDRAGCPDLNITMVAGKKYLILEKWTISSTTGNGHTIQPKIVDKNGDVAYFSGDGQVKGTGTFTLKRTFTPTVDVDKFYFAITNGAGVTVSGTFHYGMIIEYQQGMENWDIPYFEGICDAKMPILRNIGKNLFDINNPTWTNSNAVGSIVNNKIEFVGSISKYNEPYRYQIKLPSNKTYTFSYQTFGNLPKNSYPNDSCLRIMSGETVTRTIWGGASNTTFTLSNVEDGVRFDVRINKVWSEGETYSANGGMENIQLEEVTSTTSYEPYKTNILRTPETVTLRSLPNGVRDELNLKTGEYIKRIGEVVLNGTENNWIPIFNYNGTDDYSTFKLDTALPNGRTVTYPLDAYIVDKMQNVCVLSEPREFVHINAQPMVCIKLLRTKLSEQTVAGLKTWLSQNPITVQYELAEPMTTIAEPLTIPFAYEDGHIILESGSEEQSLLPELKYSVPASKNGLLSTTSQAILKHEQRLHKLENLLLREAILMDYRLTLAMLDSM